jgi:hypothetical protein
VQHPISGTRVPVGPRVTAAAAVLLALMAGLTPPAAAQAVATDASISPRAREWRIHELTVVRLAPREPGSDAPNAHPAAVAPEVLRRALGSITTVVRGRTENLFSNDELDDLVGPLVQALGAAGPGQDVELLSTARRHGNFLSTPYGVTARLFVGEEGLNLIVHDARLDFFHAYRATKVLPRFQHGSRAQAGPSAVASPQGQARRADWLVFSLHPVAAAPAKVAVPAVAPGPAAAAVPARRDERFYEEQEQRLRGLQRLREQGLITDEEFQRKRREILQLL